MGNMILWVDSFENTPYSLPCYPLDFKTILSKSADSGYYKHDAQQHIPTLTEPWLTHCFSCKAIFASGGESYQIINSSNLPASFLPRFEYQIAPSSQAYIQPKSGTYSIITGKPSDWDNICLKYIATRSRNSSYRLSLSRYTDWDQLAQAAGQNNWDILRFNYPIAMKYLVHGGLRSFSFGISNCPNSNLTYDNRNSLCSGIIIPPESFTQSENFIGWKQSNISREGFCFTDLSDETTRFIKEVTGSYANPVQGDETSVMRVQSYPCEYVIPKGTVFRGQAMTKDWQMYGVMSVSFNKYGEPVGVIVQTLSYNLWSITQGQSGNAAGPDTNSQGGHGKQGAGTDNPYNPITRNRNGGILTDPTASAGFVIYKFTPSQFTDFLNKFYTETALPSLSSLTPGRQPSAETPILDYLANLKGWSNADNIVFVKTSPVSFPSQPASLSKLSIGALGISNITAEVVTDYIAEDSRDLGSFGSAAQWFTDVEPYAAATLYFPLAGAVSIPPSILEGATGTVHFAFNLLNNGCGYSLHLQKDGSSLFYAKNGEACKSADCVIPGRNITETVGAVGALAATGISTLATGGTAAPALLTTALGAATTAVHDSIDMSISNLPPNSSGSPYDDTVNGGLRDIFLYRPKAVRFNSGEINDNNERSQVMGTFSYKYLTSLDQISEGSYFSVMDIKLEMADGMTKAEHDKIVALLKEGVWM